MEGQKEEENKIVEEKLLETADKKIA